MGRLTLMGAGGAGGAFSPTDIAGQMFWLSADTLTLSDTDPVTSWTEGFNSHVFAQTTTTKQPTYVASAVAGNPAVRFDGGDAVFNAGSVDFNPGNTSFTFLVTVKTATAQSAWFSNIGTSGYKAYEMGTGQAGITAGYLGLYGGNGGFAWTGISVDAQNDDTWRVEMITFGGGILTSYVDGVENLELTGVANADYTSASTYDLYIGGLELNTRYITGDIMDIIGYSGKISDSEVASLNDWAKARIGL